jgi:diguanylate cyclase (GGDEF)-like protein
VLFYYQGASLKDMAAFLEITPSVADHRLRAARQHLGERLLSMTQQDLLDNRPSNAPQFVLRVMDVLTRLANAEGLAARLREECQIGQTRLSGFGVVLYDVDHLLVFNAERGHVAGDALLAALAQRMRGALQADDYAARYGGDELALVLRRASAEAALTDAKAVLAAADSAEFSLGALLEPGARYGANAPQLPASPANAQFQRGLTRLQAGQPSEAAEAFRAALAADANHIPSIMELAYLDLRQALSAAQLAEPFQITLSGGLGWYQAGDTPETLIARADAGLAQAKQAGRNRVLGAG